MQNSIDGIMPVSAISDTSKKKNFLKSILIPFLLLVIVTLFVFGTVFWAQGSTFNGQPMSELLAQQNAGLLSVEEVVQNNNGLLGEYEAFRSEESTATVEEIEELQELMATRGYIVPLSDAVAGLPPVPPGSVGISSMGELSTALGQANAGTINAIHFTGPISGSLATNATNNIGAAGLDGGLIIDGRGHQWNCTAAAGTATIRVTGAAQPRALSLKNIDFQSSGTTVVGDQPSTISFSTATGSGVGSAGTNADSRFWTVNLHNIRSVTTAGAPTPVGPGSANRGLISLSDGAVNFTGNTHWTMGQRRTAVNVRMVTFDGGEHTINLTRNYTTANTAAVVGRTHLIRANPTSTQGNQMGAGVHAINGAQVDLTRYLRGGGTAVRGHVIWIHTGGLAPAGSTERPATLVLADESRITAMANPRGNGNASAALNGVVSIHGGDGGTHVSGGSQLHVENMRVGTGTSAGASAILQQIRGGNFTVTGEGSEATFITRSSQGGRQATVRFYMASGRSDQTVLVDDGARLNIERARINATGAATRAAALRFGQGPGNGFHVDNGIVDIRHFGNGAPRNPATSNANGQNAAVEFASNTWFFRVTGDADIHVLSAYGAAINARGHNHGQIQVTEGANFTAMGRTAGVAVADAIIRGTGGNVHFYMNHPQFYDFVNTRPAGGRVFALGTAAGNSFTSTNSDISTWRRGVNAWNGDPDRHWTLINVRLSGAQLRTVDAAVSYGDFVEYYNTAPHSRRMESFTRISGNNSRPVLTEALDLTNADRHVRALVEVPQGHVRDPRPVWTNEVWGNFTGICAQTGTEVTRTSNDAPIGALVRSYQNETLYEVETNVTTEYGVLKMTHDDGRFLRAGDIYRVDAAWRATTPGLPRNHQAANIPPAFQFEAVRDVIPPMPVMINDMVVPIDQVTFGGTWALADTFDDGPRIGSDGIRLYARNGNNPVRPITGTGLVTADNNWTFTANPAQLFAGDIVWVSLADTQNPPNWNPLQPTPKRDLMIPEASWFIVAADGTMPLIVQNFFSGVEYVNYRHIAHQMTFPNPGDTRTAQIGTGASTAIHTYTPPRDRRGYMVESIELRGPGGAVQNIPFGADGRPLAPIQVEPGWQTIHVHRVHDPDYTRDILIEFRFADFGGTNLQSWVLQVPVPYNQIRTGTFNQTGVNRFPGQGVGDIHITETLTHARVLGLVNELFVGEYDLATGEQIAPPAIDGLPRGFTPCPTEHIQLPVQGPGGATPQLTFPVSMADLYDARFAATPGAERRPVVVNFVATLEEVVLDQTVERCPYQGGTTAQFNTFDNMSFNYQVTLHRGPVGGPTAAANGGAIPWTDHRLEVFIETERAEENDEGELPGWAHYEARTWISGGTPGSIRIGTWNDATAGTGDAGSGTASAAFRQNRRIAPDENVTISNVPSTAYIEVIQQINAGPAGTGNNTNQAWLNSAINSLHERDFEDSYTEQVYLWPASTTHLSTDSNISHTTNWANVLPTDTNPNYNPSRPMDNMSRDFDFRLIPQRSFEVTVANYVDGDGADPTRERYFSVQIRNAAGAYVETGRVLQMWLGEHEEVFVGIDPETDERMYEDRRVLTPVTVGANGIVSTGLPALAPGESFSLMRLGGMYDVRAVMLDFPNHDAYDVYNHFVREREAVPSTPVSSMNSGVVAINRDNTTINFESYRDWIIPTGIVVGGISVFGVMLAATIGTLAVVSARRRKEIESVPAVIGPIRGGSSAQVGAPSFMAQKPVERVQGVVANAGSFMRTILLRVLR